MDNYDYVPRAPFIPLHDRSQRWAVIICHRRCGKTLALINDLIIRALHKPNALRRQFAYLAPYQNQARTVVWQYAKDYTAPFSRCPGYRISEQNLTITLPDPGNLNRSGATIMLLGAENAERLRGIFLDGAVIDEFQDISPYVWDSILRPALADRQGFAVFSGTVKGHDNPLWEFYQKAKMPNAGWFHMLVKASESGILPNEELDDLKRSMTPEAYASEMECDPDATVTGRIFLPYLIQQQVTKVPYQTDASQIITGWDLGMSDTTSIWTAQTAGKEVHLLDYYEQSGKGLDHFVDWLRHLPYARNYGAHLMPHDTNVRELGTGVSRLETLRRMGMRNVIVVPKLSKDQQIDAARMLLSRCWFDEDNTAQGLRSLRGYRYGFDQKRQCFSNSPEHTKESNGADAFQTLAVGMKKASSRIESLSDPRYDLIDESPITAPWQGDSVVF